MNLSVVTTQTFETEVLRSEKPVLVEFGAVWCQPCKKMEPVLQKIAVENPEFKVCTVDVDESPELAAQFKVRSAPTFMVFKQGKLVSTVMGTATPAKLLDLLK